MPRKSEFMKFGDALEIVLQLAKQNIASKLNKPHQFEIPNLATITLAILTVEDWGTNNLDEDD